ncbi:MAG: AMP-binding protein [Pseudomonadales bacterium]
MSKTLFERACANAPTGMEISAIAAEVPDRIAIYSDQGTLTFSALNDKANQTAHMLRSRGLGNGDSVALLCSNRQEFAIVRFACHRMGVRLTPVNWHLSADEIAYIVDNCDAKAFFADVRVGSQARDAISANNNIMVKVAIGGDIEGFETFESALNGQSTEDISSPRIGNVMQYTSGTTGRPKGVSRAFPDPDKVADLAAMFAAVFQFQPDSDSDCTLATGPLYHAGPFNLCFHVPLTAGISTVIMDKWEPEKMLQLIEEHKITHTFCVPTMFVRLLQLDAKTRSTYNISSLRFLIHGAAPCSVETKHAMMNWFGPIIWEMFAGTEGPGTLVSPQEWLQNPGTVGRVAPGQIMILDDEGNEQTAGIKGTVYIRGVEGSHFQYHKDPEKTASVSRGEYFTAGDIGYLDEQGYLFLTGRSAEVIISGGVNIYPQEIDDVLATHDAIADVACIGVPNDDWGEEIKAVVQLRKDLEPSVQLEIDLIAYCNAKLASQKQPRSIDFVETVPRSDAGKVLRSRLRAQYWHGKERQI